MSDTPDWDRRRFLQTAGVGGAGLLTVGLGAACSGESRPGTPGADSSSADTTASAAGQGSAIRLVHLASRTESAAGEAATAGARMGAEEATYSAQLFDRDVQFAAETAAPGQAMQAARDLFDQHRPHVLVGALGGEAAGEMSALAGERNALFFNAASPSEALRAAPCRRTTFHVDASEAMYVDAIGQWLTREADLRRWFFLSPGTEAGQNRLERARRLLGDAGGSDLGSAQVGPENAAAALETAAAADPEVVFLNATGQAQIDVLRAYNQLQPGFEVAGPLPAFYQMRSAGADAVAGTWPLLWHHSTFKYGARQVNNRFQQQFDRPIDARAWASWAAVTFAIEAALKAPSTDAEAIAEHLETNARFDSRKGKPLTFRPWNHQARQILYLVQPTASPDGEHDLFEMVGEVPSAIPGDFGSTEEALDQLGTPQTESPCRLA